MAPKEEKKKLHDLDVRDEKVMRPKGSDEAGKHLQDMAAGKDRKSAYYEDRKDPQGRSAQEKRQNQDHK